MKKLVVTGAVYGRDVTALRGQLEPDVVIGTVYAATEFTRIAAFDLRRGQTCAADELLPVGRPYAGMRVRIERDDGQPAAVGERGRLYVSTPYLSRGYYGDEAATAQRFVRRADGVLECDTSDLASLDAEGFLRIHGRQDNVVKIRMQRIDLAEVDAALQTLLALKSAAAYVREAGSAREKLAALVTLHAGATLDMQTLRTALAQTLPQYMIPTDVRVAAELPQTRTHKIDRTAIESAADALPMLPLHALEGTNLRDDVERELAAIWSDALGTSITDRYTELCEPNAAQDAVHVALQRVRTSMGVALTPADVQANRTLAELAVIVRERRRGMQRDQLR